MSKYKIWDFFHLLLILIFLLSSPHHHHILGISLPTTITACLLFLTCYVDFSQCKNTAYKHFWHLKTLVSICWFSTLFSSFSSSSFYYNLDNHEITSINVLSFYGHIIHYSLGHLSFEHNSHLVIEIKNCLCVFSFQKKIHWCGVLRRNTRK